MADPLILTKDIFPVVVNGSLAVERHCDGDGKRLGHSKPKTIS